MKSFSTKPCPLQAQNSPHRSNDISQINVSLEIIRFLKIVQESFFYSSALGPCISIFCFSSSGAWLELLFDENGELQIFYFTSNSTLSEDDSWYI